MRRIAGGLAMFAGGMVFLGGSALLGGALGGCAGYDTYSGEGEGVEARDINERNSHEVMIASIEWVIERYPPESADGRFALNLPRGSNETTYRFVTSQVGENALPMTPDVDPGVPVYHIAGVRLRGTEARVDVVRPAPELGKNRDGSVKYVGVELRLDGGFQPWRVKLPQRTWAPGTIAVPELYYMPGSVPEQEQAAVEEE